MKMVSISQVLFGSDYPIRPVSEAVAGVASYAFSPAERRAIERDNALRLLPRLDEYIRRSENAFESWTMR